MNGLKVVADSGKPVQIPLPWPQTLGPRPLVPGPWHLAPAF